MSRAETIEFMLLRKEIIENTPVSVLNYDKSLYDEYIAIKDKLNELGVNE